MTGTRGQHAVSLAEAEVSRGTGLVISQFRHMADRTAQEQIQNLGPVTPMLVLV